MVNEPFIKIYHSIEEASAFKYSPYDMIRLHNGVQLLPNSNIKIIQSTDNPIGIEIEDWEVKLVNTSDLTETDITNYFNVEEVFFDDNGQNQVSWSLLNIPFDFGVDRVYLKIMQFDKTFYSNCFLLTNFDKEKTTLFHYKNEEDEIMQSITLKVFFREEILIQELSSYHSINRNTTVTAFDRTKKYEKYVLPLATKSFYINFIQMFSNVYLYIDFKSVNLFNPIELPELVGLRNGVEGYAYISFTGVDVYDPNFVPPTALPHYSPEHYSSEHYSTI